MADVSETISRDKSLIEKWLPVRALSRDAAIEMAYKAKPAYIKHCRELKIPEKNISRRFFDPKIRNLHPWFARRPCSIARAITLASALPVTISNENFKKAIGWYKKSQAFTQNAYPPLLFYTDPDRKLINELLTKFLGKPVEDIVVCDPMAGGGTIPLESLRLGFKSIAVEYNPVAYLILKGTIEYPALYGLGLAERVRNESKKLIKHSQDVLGKFYPPGSEGYIIARGIECPNCGGKIPLLSNTQIARSVYLNLKVNRSIKTFNYSIVRCPTKFPYKKRRSQIICPYCNTIINKKEAYRSWTIKHINILKELKEGVVNRDKILSTHILFIRQTKGDYRICNEKDFSCFLEACREFSKSFKEIEEYLPKGQIPENNEVFAPLRKCGIKRWYELFNPRQLLAVGRLVKYVYDRCKKVAVEDGLDVAVNLYLAFGISRMADYNSTITTWKRGTIRDAIGQYAQGRKMRYSENYCEAIVPYRNLNWIYETNSVNRKTEGGICPILNELCNKVGNLGNILVMHGDSRLLASILPNTLVDIINVDPPYFDQHTYSDISEYFWQVLHISLKPLIKAGFLFKEKSLSGWEPKCSFVPHEGEVIVRRSKKAGKEPLTSFNSEWYTEQMGEIFKECFKVLSKDGILLVWFTHKSIEAWKAIISALYAGGFFVTKIWPVTSELLTRLVSKGGNSALNRTLIICARKREEKEINERELKDSAIKLMKEIGNVLTEMGTTKLEFRNFLRAATICAITRAPLPKDKSKNPIEFCKSELIPWSVKLADEMFPTLYEQINQRRLKHTLENFL